jgi:hypothetical protein
LSAPPASQPTQRGLLRGFESAKVTFCFEPLKQGTHSARAALLMLPAEAAAAGAPGRAGGSGATDAAAAAVAALDAAEEAAQAAQAGGSGSDGDAAAPSSSRAASAGAASTGPERLILAVEGEATQGALRIEPASIAFGAMRVGHPLTRTVSLVNQSSGVLRYAAVLLDERAPGGADDSDAPVVFSSPTAALSGGARATAAAAGGGGGGGGGGDGCAACWLDAPQGVVNPRSSKQLQLTILPRRRGQYRLRLNLHALADDLGARGSSAGSSPAATHMHSSHHRRALSAAAGAPACSSRAPGELVRGASPASGSSSSSGGGGGACGKDTLGGIRTERSACAGAAAVAAASEAAARGVDADAEGAAVETAAGAGTHAQPQQQACGTPLASACVTAHACFPSLLVTDAFSEGTPKQVRACVIAGRLLSSAIALCAVRATPAHAHTCGRVRVDTGVLAAAGPQPAEQRAAGLSGHRRAARARARRSWLPHKRQRRRAAATARGGPGRGGCGRAAAGALGAAEQHQRAAAGMGAAQLRRAPGVWRCCARSLALACDARWAACAVRADVRLQAAPAHTHTHVLARLLAPLRPTRRRQHRQVDLESWVEPAKPQTQAERERTFMLERRVFEVVPRSGRLAPGAAQQVRGRRALLAAQVVLRRQLPAHRPPAVLASSLQGGVCVATHAVRRAQAVGRCACVALRLRAHAGVPALQPRGGGRLPPAALPAH